MKKEMIPVIIIIITIIAIYGYNVQQLRYTKSTDINPSANIFIVAHLVAGKDKGDMITTSFSSQELGYSNPNITIGTPLKVIINWDARCGSVLVRINDGRVDLDSKLSGNTPFFRAWNAGIPLGQTEINIGNVKIDSIYLRALWYPDGRGESNSLSTFCALTPSILDFTLVRA